MNIKKYFLHNGAEQQGPFDIDELKAKRINKETQIWYEGLSAWTNAGSVDDLKELFNAPIPPPFNQSKPKPIERNEPQKKSILGKVLIVAVIIVLALIGLFVFNLLQQQQAVQEQQKQNQIQAEIDKAEQEAKNKVRSNIYSYVTITRNSIAVDNLLGGITNLTYTVTNNCSYTLDNVKVKINYIKSDGDIYQSRIINIRGLAPNSQTKLDAPDCSRGTSVSESIEEIKSTDLGL